MKKNIYLIKNFLYSFKEIYKIDKLYLYNKIFSSLLGSTVLILYSLIMKIVIFCIEKNIEFSNFVIKVFSIVSVVFIIVVYQRLAENWSWHREEKIINILKHKVSIKTLEFDYQEFEEPELQDLYEKVISKINGAGSIVGIIKNGFLIIKNFLTLLMSTIILSNLSYILLIIIVLLAILKMIIENKNNVRQKREFFDIQPSIIRRINYTNNISRNLEIGKDLRVFKLSKFINKEREIAINEWLDLNSKNERKNIKYNIILNIIKLLDTLVLYVFLICEVLYNKLLISDFTFMFSSVNSLVISLNQIISMCGNMTRLSLEVNDYKEFNNIAHKKEYLNEIKCINEIEFKNVYFKYNNQHDFVLKNISFKIEKGKKIALVGFNGAGKTTLVKLLLGLYHPTKGQILINNIDIETIKRESLVNFIAPVFQECSIYSLSIEDNISMTNPNKVDKNRFNKAINLVDLTEKIKSLSMKEKTILTRDLEDEGILLSGGEIQKISLARAFYKKTDLFILDEPTSAMDAISESKLYKSFNNITKGKTTIFITHRLSSTKFCDKIFFIKDGSIIEVGTHEELMLINSEYKKLFNTQAQYYITNKEVLE